MPIKKKKSALYQRESDSAYVLKLVLYVVLGSLWIKFADPVYIGDIVVNAVPIGLVLGIIFASHDHFQVDRKIEYAILILMTVISYFLPAGIVI
ncbi:MAG: hypothetical protein ABIR46_03610 [Candidatus Saccharimonadales bacterium]